MGRTTDIMIQQLWDKKSKRKALLILLLSDLCLFLVGGYLIYSWVGMNEGGADKPKVEIFARGTRPAKELETTMKPHDEGMGQKGSTESGKKTNKKEDTEQKESPEKQNGVKNEERPDSSLRKDETSEKKITEKTERSPREIRKEPKTDNEKDNKTDKGVHGEKRDSDEKRKEQQNFLIGVRNILSKKGEDFKKCYTRATKPGGERLAGSIQLRFQLQSNGHVENVITVSNTTGSTTLEKCILSITKKIHFPKPPKGVKEFLYPLSFSAQ